VRLLLDEHFSPEIARQLRRRGHDVVAVAERSDLVARADRVHCASAPDHRRAIVTQDLGDFRPLLAESLRAGRPTYGLVCVPGQFPLSRRTIGEAVQAMDELLRRFPGDEDLTAQGGEIWLQI
jgi:predicted nuclease of predicted toxin-antitoxin system